MSDAKALIIEGLRRRQEDGVAAAVDCFTRAAQLEPKSYLPLLMLGNAASELGDLDAAVGHLERARSLEPYNHDIRFNLGLNQLLRGYADAAIAELQVACDLHPVDLAARSCYFLGLHHSDGFSPEQIAAKIREWGAWYVQRHALKVRSVPRQDANRLDTLRVGFVSGDFREHSVAHFFEPIAAERDRGAYRYVFYNTSPEQDLVTERLRRYADEWRDVAQLTDPALMELIARDRIDILVDLAGHTHGGRLAVFAGRAAPVQVTYLGFPNGTGLPTMDYRITDAITDPPSADAWHAERLLRLPASQWCYRAFGPRIAPGPLPALAAGFVTFGSFNSLTKVSDVLLRCWGDLMRQMPSSRLRLTRVRSPRRAADVMAALGQLGVAAGRIDCVPHRGDVPQGTQFAGVDIALDHYPYNGVTTTCESLDNGLPVVSLYGRHSASRSGLSILSNLGLDELAASSPQGYVGIALTLARDLPRLEQLRGSLRSRFDQSPLRDEKRFAADFEQVLRTAWHGRRI
jgi:protein O-GlcNAc transferase